MSEWAQAFVFIDGESIGAVDCSFDPDARERIEPPPPRIHSTFKFSGTCSAADIENMVRYEQPPSYLELLRSWKINRKADPLAPMPVIDMHEGRRVSVSKDRFEFNTFAWAESFEPTCDGGILHCAAFVPVAEAL